MKVRRTTAPSIGPETTLVVSGALLPMLHWRGVQVLREERRELTVLERFVLEMALTLGGVTPEDFAEVTSLPASTLAGMAAGLVGDGALVSEGRGFRVRHEQAARTLRRQAVSRVRPGTADFVLLPRTGDLVVVSDGWLRDLEQKVVAEQRAPVPRSLWPERRAAYLARRLKEMPADGIVDVPVPDDDPPLVPQTQATGDFPAAGVCPAYRCRAEVRTDGSAHVVVSGRPRRGSQDEREEVQIELRGVDGLVASWLKLADAVADPDVRQEAWRELAGGRDVLSEWEFELIGPALAGHRRLGPARWEFQVDGQAAEAVAAQGRALVEPMGLALHDDEAVVEVTCRLFPIDDEARALFARDEVIARLLAADDPAAELPRAGPLSEEALRERIWQLGHYQLVYDLREREDFTYD